LYLVVEKSIFESNGSAEPSFILLIGNNLIALD